MPLRVLTVFGTRPEAIKMAPLVKLLEGQDGIESQVCVTAQHREMLDQVLSLFQIAPDYDLDVMVPGQDLCGLTAKVLTKMGPVLRRCSPDVVLVHGDTTTTLAASLAAFYHDVPVGHVEAGLRTGDLRAPWPEEANRRLSGVLTHLHFAPTAAAACSCVSRTTCTQGARSRRVSHDSCFIAVKGSRQRSTERSFG